MYTMNGGYRKTKIFIDYSNVVLTVAIVVMFVAILFMGSNAGILFPLIFLAGSTVNIMQAVKRYIAGNKVGCGVSAGVGVILLILSGCCLSAIK